MPVARIVVPDFYMGERMGKRKSGQKLTQSESFLLGVTTDRLFAELNASIPKATNWRALH